MVKNDKVKKKVKSKESKESPVKDKITKAEEIFVNELIRGKSQRQAFLRAYPEKASWKWASIDSAASTLLKREKVSRRYDALMNRIRTAELEKTKWTREQAIETLKDVIKRNVEEHGKIQTAVDDEIEYLLEKIKKNPRKAEEYTRELLRKRKTRIVSFANNSGVISAVSELNKVQGFNEETINLNGSVVFSGEDRLEN